MPGATYNVYSVFTTITHFERIFNFKYIIGGGVQVNALLLTALSKYKLQISTDSDNSDANAVITPTTSDGVGNYLGLNFAPSDLYAQNQNVNTNFLITIDKNETTASEGVEILFDEELFLLLPFDAGHYTNQECVDFTSKEKDKAFKDDPCFNKMDDPECHKITIPTPTPKEESKGLGGGAIAGIVIGVIAAIVIIAVLVWLFVFRKKSSATQPEP